MSDRQLSAQSVLQVCAQAGVVDAGHQFMAINRGSTLRWLLPAETLRCGAVLSAWRPYGALSTAVWTVVRRALPLLSRGPVRRFSAPDGTKRGDLGDLEPVVFVGTPGPRQKLVCHMVDGGGNVRFVIKVPIGRDASLGIAHEATILGKLAASASELPVPRLLNLDGLTGISVQTWVDGVPSARKFGPLHREFLDRLCRPEETLCIADSLENLRERVNAAPLTDDSRRSIEALFTVEGSGAVLPSCWVHGDFAPWNLKRWGRQTVALDWEDGEERGLPLQDLSHYFASSSYLFRLGGTPLQRMRASDAAQPLIQQHGPDVLRALFSHYCLAGAVRSFERGEQGFGRYLLAVAGREASA